MTITLTDIPTAVVDYLSTKVTTLVSSVEADTGSLNPNEEGLCTVTVTNAAAPEGLPLVNVVYHLKSTDGDVFQLKVTGSAGFESRATIDENDPTLPINTFVDEMFVWHRDRSIDVGVEQVFGQEVKGVDEGNAKITCHIHAEIDENALFARKLGPTIERNVKVR